MNALRNNVQLIGRLGNDPQIKDLDNGNRMANFSIATKEVYTNGKGEQKEETHWHRVVVWGKKVDIVEKFLKKGNEVGVQGKLTSREYESNGEKKYVTEVRLSELLLMGGKPTE